MVVSSLENILEIITCKLYIKDDIMIIIWPRHSQLIGAGSVERI